MNKQANTLKPHKNANKHENERFKANEKLVTQWLMRREKKSFIVLTMKCLWCNVFVCRIIVFLTLRWSEWSREVKNELLAKRTVKQKAAHEKHEQLWSRNVCDRCADEKVNFFLLVLALAALISHSDFIFGISEHWNISAFPKDRPKLLTSRYAFGFQPINLHVVFARLLLVLINCKRFITFHTQAHLLCAGENIARATNVLLTHITIKW